MEKSHEYDLEEQDRAHKEELEKTREKMQKEAEAELDRVIGEYKDKRRASLCFLKDSSVFYFQDPVEGCQKFRGVFIHDGHQDAALHDGHNKKRRPYKNHLLRRGDLSWGQWGTSCPIPLSEQNMNKNSRYLLCFPQFTLERTDAILSFGK